MKKLKYLLFLIPFMFNINVFADDFNVSSSITAPTCSGNSCSGGHYTGLENYNVGSNNVYTINTRYNGRLGAIRFNIPLPNNWPDGECFSSGDLSYRLTLNMATEDWRNYFSRPFISNSSSGSNWATSNIVFVSMKKIYFDFKIPNSNSCYDFLYVYLQSSNQSSVSFTGVNNWNLSSVVLTANFPTTPTPAPTATPKPDSSNTDIINNNNNNTNRIIDNNNTNTQTIIDNNNQNNENIIENNNQNTTDIINNINKACPLETNINNPDLYYDSQGYLDSSGNIVSGAYNVSKYLQIKPNSDYDINFNFGVSDPIYSCLYNARKVLTRCISSNSRLLNFTSSDSEYYLRITGSRRSSQIYPVYINGPICNDWDIELQQDQTDAINKVNDSINNSNIENNLGSGFFDDFTSQDFGLSQIITIPLNTIQSLTSKSCIPLNVPIPFTNSNLTLPCMTEIYTTKFPSIYNLWKIVSFGIVAYLIAIDIFHIVKGFKDPESDKVEVLDL